MENLFEIIFILVFIVGPVIGKILERFKRDQTPSSPRPTPEEGRRKTIWDELLNPEEEDEFPHRSPHTENQRPYSPHGSSTPKSAPKPMSYDLYETVASTPDKDDPYSFGEEDFEDDQENALESAESNESAFFNESYLKDDSEPTAIESLLDKAAKPSAPKEKHFESLLDEEDVDESGSLFENLRSSYTDEELLIVLPEIMTRRDFDRS